MRCSGGVGHRSKVSGGAGVEADRGLGCALEVEVARLDLGEERGGGVWSRLGLEVGLGLRSGLGLGLVLGLGL